MMNKRGTSLTMEQIVIAVLVLVVLVVLILVFRSLISGSVSQYLGIGNQAAQEANLSNVKCTSGLFTVRVCGSGKTTADFYWHNIGNTPDCPSGCYERGDPKPNAATPTTTPAKK